MSRTTLASAAFLLFALAVAAWVLTRAPKSENEAADGGAVATSGAGLTFAEWSVRNDAILMADIDPGAGSSTVPRRFKVFSVRAVSGQPVTLSERQSLSWAPADRVASALALNQQGFHVSVEGAAYTPPDALFSDPIKKSDGGATQDVVLRGKNGEVATLTRKRGADWNRRAIGFPASAGGLVYVTPDAVVVSSSGGL
jgi:hypothetical protein